MDSDTYARQVVALARVEASNPHGDLGGTVNADLRKWLHDYAGGKCALCGGMTRLDGRATDADTAEVSHVISVGDSKRGRGVGNVFNGCRACNVATDNSDLSKVLHLFADVFAIPVEWPTRGAMRANNPRKIADNGDAAKARRAALGFDF